MNGSISNAIFLILAVILAFRLDDCSALRKELNVGYLKHGTARANNEAEGGNNLIQISKDKVGEDKDNKEDRGDNTNKENELEEKDESESNDREKEESESSNKEKEESESSDKEKEESESSDKEKEESGSSDKEKEDSGSSDKEKEDSGSNDKEKEESGSNDKEKEESGSNKEKEESEGNDKEKEESGSNKEKEESGSNKEKEESGSNKEKEESGSNDKEKEESGSNDKEKEESGSSDKEKEEFGDKNGDKTVASAKTENVGTNSANSKQDKEKHDVSGDVGYEKGNKDSLVVKQNEEDVNEEDLQKISDDQNQEDDENNNFDINAKKEAVDDVFNNKDNMHTSVMEKLYKLDYKLKFLRRLVKDDKKMLVQLHALGYLTESIKQQIVRDVAALNDTVIMEAENARELNKLQLMHDMHVNKKLDFTKHENILAVND